MFDDNSKSMFPIAHGGELIQVSSGEIQDSAGIILNFKILPAES